MTLNIINLKTILYIILLSCRSRTYQWWRGNSSNRTYINAANAISISPRWTPSSTTSKFQGEHPPVTRPSRPKCKALLSHPMNSWTIRSTTISPIFIKKENSKSKFKPTIPQERNSSIMQQQKWRTRYE